MLTLTANNVFYGSFTVGNWVIDVQGTTVYFDAALVIDSGSTMSTECNLTTNGPVSIACGSGISLNSGSWAVGNNCTVSSYGIVWDNATTNVGQFNTFDGGGEFDVIATMTTGVGTGVINNYGCLGGC